MVPGDKSQGVRLVDVLVLGPFMVWAGMQGRLRPDWANAALVVSGVATIFYNGRNYLINSKRLP
jgi:hypothetical protein